MGYWDNNGMIGTIGMISSLSSRITSSHHNLWLVNTKKRPQLCLAGFWGTNFGAGIIVINFQLWISYLIHVLMILESQDFNHGHYIHYDDNWGRKWTRSPIALCLRSDWRLSPPWAKTPPVQHQDWIVELKITTMPPQNNKAVPEYAAPTKIQQATCATYPVPLPTPVVITTVLVKMMIMILKCLSATWRSSGTTAMKTLIAQDAPRIKIFLQEASNNLIGEKIPPLHWR